MKSITKLLAVLLVFSMVLTGCSSTTQSIDANSPSEVEAQKETDNVADDYVVRLTYSGSLCQAPLQMAHELGYFEEEGIQVEFIKSEQASADLMITGQLDVYQDMIPKIVQQVENGLDIKVTAGVHTGCLKVVTLAGSDEINTIQDLKGKKIGVPGLASSQAIIVQRTLTEYGIGATPENMEVEFVVFNAADLQLALENGSVDAISLSDPSASKIVDSGIGKLIFDQSTDPLYEGEYCCVFAFSPQFIKEHPELAAKTLKALQKSGVYVNENPAETAKKQIDGAYVAGDEGLNAKLLESYNFSPSIAGGREAILNNIQDMQALGMISKDLEAESIVNKIFVQLEGSEEVQ